ncbi:MAG: exodeoxyribonuclease VII large subunit [Desulfovibrio sp.]|jgi:exodeoxyribonuclease VII large subunit|nr:exodeoxyribonuclease VII large subunit [Desulfovibrio sp.]
MTKASEHILSVTALTEAIRTRLEASFPFVWVRGQVTNLAKPASGHVYFSLRDEECSLAAVWFKSDRKADQRFDPLTGEVFEGGPRPSLALTLENGQEVICAGRVAVYGARGQYQLIVEFAQDAGASRLHEEFERLRRKLADLGYFALERKRPMPPQPRRVALITSPTGAAVHDFLRVAQGRGLGSRVRLYPVPVQGEAAPARIGAALLRVADEGWAQVAVLIRGGGSMEDLWAFNDEAVARTIFGMPLPVLAGIGHEVDFTLADMTADLRAATPSHAAQLLWPDRAETARRLRVFAESLMRAADRSLEIRNARLTVLDRTLALLSPARRLAERQERLQNACLLMDRAWRDLFERCDARLQRLALGLAACPASLPGRKLPLDMLEGRVVQAGNRFLERSLHAGERLRLRLDALDPMAPLERGYALVRKENGAFVRKTSQAASGEALRLVVSDGEIPVRVEGETDHG